MGTQPTVPGSEAKKKRPLLVAVICVVMFLGAVFAVPLVFSEAARKIGRWYPLFLAAGGAAGLLSAVGLWKMKKWGFFLYCGLTVVNQVVLVATDKWIAAALVIPVVVIALVLTQLSKMD